MRRRLAFQAAHHGGYGVFRRDGHYHVEIILVKANRLDGDTRHTSQQAGQLVHKGSLNGGLQNPAAVLADPDNMVLEFICAMTRKNDIHSPIVPPRGIHPRLKPWCSVGYADFIDKKSATNRETFGSHGKN